MNPFALEPGTIPLPRVRAQFKLIALVFLSLSAMRLRLYPLAALLASTAAYALAHKVDLAGARRTYLFVLYISLFSAAVRGFLPGDGRVFATESLPGSALYALRLLTVFIFAQVFFATTKVSEVGDAATAVFRFLKAKKRKTAHASAPPGSRRGDSILADPGILLYLAIVFLPKAFDHYAKVSEAAKTRGYGRRGAARKFRAVLAVFQAFVFANIKGAIRTSQAMELRCYSPDRTLVSYDRVSPATAKPKAERRRKIFAELAFSLIPIALFAYSELAK